MAVPEQFSLRWNDFHSNLSQSFHALLECEDLVDVTLAAGGQYVHAHKLILSVCSPYFKELFKMNPCEHPIVILKDVAHHELRQLLQFMYRGEVHVRRQELSGFLHTAELLQVKGLTGGREQSESPSPPQEEPPKPAHQQPEPAAEHSSDWGSGVEDTTSSVEIASDQADTVTIKEEATRSPLKRLLKNTPNKTSHNVKKKPRPVKDSPTHPENTEYAYDGEPLIDFDNDLFHSVLVLPESAKESGWNCKTGGVKCPSCHRFFANRYNLKVHIRDKHDTREGTLQCDICQKRMRNPSCLRVHMYHHRKQAAYLAQLTTQGEQMKHVVQNMVGGKWRSESAIAAVDYKDIDNYQPGQASESNKSYIAQRSGQGDQMRQAVQNMTGGKWRSDSSSGSTEYRDVDNYPSATDSNRSQTFDTANVQSVPDPVPNCSTSGSALPKPEADVETA